MDISFIDDRYKDYSIEYNHDTYSRLFIDVSFPISKMANKACRILPFSHTSLEKEYYRNNRHLIKEEYEQTEKEFTYLASQIVCYDPQSKE